jgi:dTDP-4-dehydrorhamnose 3,5-epimerase-like enzyme
MKINIEIKEPIIINVQSISDDRGLLVPFTDEIDHSLFHRCYYVENYGRGVIRGLHYHKEEVKVFSIASGAAKFITFKLPEVLADKNDPLEISKYARENPGSIRTWVISNRHHAVLYIPAYYANGWVSLEDHSVLIGLSNLRFEKAKNDDLRIDPYVVGENYWKVIGR